MAGYSKNTIRRTTINNAISSSYVLTASYALNVSGGGGGGGGTPGGSDTQVQYNNGGSFGGVPTLIYSSSILIGTGSFSGSFTGSFYGTASWANNVVQAITASYSDNFIISGSLTLNETFTQYAIVSSTIIGTNDILVKNTGSYRSAFAKYVVYSGSNSRAGEFITTWGNSFFTDYFDNSTNDLGDTSDITFRSIIASGQVRLRAVANSTGWTIKMLVTFI